jgi:hypothetical protein
MNSARHDRAAIREVLTRVAGEPKRQQYTRAGRAVPARLERGARQFRSRYGTGLLPAAGATATATGDEIRRSFS